MEFCRDLSNTDVHFEVSPSWVISLDFLPHSSTIAAKGIRANARTTFTLRIPFSWKSIGSYCSWLDSRSTPKHRATRGIGAWPFSWLSVDHIGLSIYNFELRRFWSVRYYGETQRAKAIFFTIGFSKRFNSFCYSRPFQRLLVQFYRFKHILSSQENFILTKLSHIFKYNFS